MPERPPSGSVLRVERLDVDPAESTSLVELTRSHRRMRPIRQRHGLTLLTTDRDFERIAAITGLTVWRRG